MNMRICTLLSAALVIAVASAVVKSWRNWSDETAVIGGGGGSAGLSEIDSVMADVGYRRAASMVSPSDFNVDGYKAEFHVPNCTSLLFVPGPR